MTNKPEDICKACGGYTSDCTASSFHLDGYYKYRKCIRCKVVSGMIFVEPDSKPKLTLIKGEKND